MDALAAGVGGMALATLELPTRPSYGTEGRAIGIIANHYDLDLDGSGGATVHMYTLSILGAPPQAKRGAPPGSGPPARQFGGGGQGDPHAGSTEATLPLPLCRGLVKQLSKQENWPPNGLAYDGRSQLYSNCALALRGPEIPGVGHQFMVMRPGSEVPPPGTPPDEQDKFTLTLRAIRISEMSKMLASLGPPPQGQDRPRDTRRLGGGGDETETDLLQALDVLLRQTRAEDPRWMPVGRMFLDSQRTRDLGVGLEVWLGYRLSARPSQRGPVIIVDRAVGAFLKEQPLIDFMLELGGDSRTKDDPRRLDQLLQQQNRRGDIMAGLRGVRVQLMHFAGARRSKRIAGMAMLPASQQTFRDQEGRERNVQNYYKEQHGIDLRAPFLPPIDCGGGGKSTFFPVELCQVAPGQRKGLITDPRASSEMIKNATQRPQDRIRAIHDIMSESIRGDPVPKAYGLNIGKDMTRLQGRLLPPPNVVYADNQLMQPRDGSWNLKGNIRLLEAGEAVDRWAVISLTSDMAEQQCEQLAQALARAMNQTGGIRVNGPPVFVVPQRNQPIADVARELAANRQGKPQIVFIALHDYDVALYNTIKETFECRYGMITQCMLRKHLNYGGGGGGYGGGRGGPPPQFQQQQGGGGRGGGRGDRFAPSGGTGPKGQYIANIILKVNAKLGGRNNSVAPSGPPQGGPQMGGSPHARVLPLLDRPTMLFGADVSHAAPGSDAKSIAAVVGTLDATACKNATRISQQENRLEIIEDLKEMCKSLLLSFERKTSHRPERLIFFRDGVSEGQFQIVLREELTALKLACKEMGDGSYNPPICFIIVQKRHHTRLFVSDPRTGDRSGNPPAGTVVDTGICHPTEYDFFLMSHAGIQGTSRPVHYHVIHDEIGCQPDDLQRLCFSLCHLFCRCTRSTSLVPPVYYAHLAANRGRIYAEATTRANVAPAGVEKSLEDAMFFV